MIRITSLGMKCTLIYIHCVPGTVLSTLHELIYFSQLLSKIIIPIAQVWKPRLREVK